ncbi:MAG TPA: DegT/DnrJ/EryC1/StrS family aminotransferase [bacterium]|nr:DegT/DnrJ/EryC1/StrS family aminotransferase [bacterium]
MKKSNFIPVSQPIFLGNEKKYLINCIDTGWISSLGKYISVFEKKFSNYCGVKYGVAVANGTVALHLLLKTLDINKNDEVIIPDLTFIATANAVSYTGAKPVMIDSDMDSWNINVDLIERYITPKTKAIIAVHLYGQPCNMKKILYIARKYNLLLIEDCAEAHGAEFDNKKIGSFGVGGCFSFYGNKVITSGEGGMIVTNNKKIFEKLLFLRDHAMSTKKRYYHSEIGFNYRMTNLQAAVGLAQLEKIDKILNLKNEIEKEYIENLADIGNIKFQKIFYDRKKICWLFSALVNENKTKNRNGLINHLLKNNIDSRPFFIPMTNLPPYYCKRKNSNALFLSKKGINLPSSINICESQIKYICKKIKNYFFVKSFY